MLMQAEAEPLTHRTDLVDLVSFDEQHVVDLCCQHLNEQGVETHFYNERGLQSLVFLTKPRASLKVQVKDEHYAKAVTLLIEFEKAHPQIAPLIHSCPECGSFAVEYPQFTRKFITPLFLEWLSNLGLFKEQFYCRKCHCLWSKTSGTQINRHHLDPAPSLFVSPPG